MLITIYLFKSHQFQARTIETNAYAKIVRASVSISTIQNLIEMPEVCYISLVSPPAIPEDIKKSLTDLTQFILIFQWQEI